MSNSTAPQFAYSEPRARTLRAGRIPELLLVVTALALFGLSLHRPWWFFKLYAPQYPRGLSLVIALDGLSGDVREIDMLNHYIGMAHLDAAAAFERAHAAYAVAGLMTVVLGLALFVKRRGSALIALAGALFPLGFLADSFYWLHRFGHELDPHAP